MTRQQRCGRLVEARGHGRLERLYGYSRAEAVGRHASMLFPPGQQDTETELMARHRAR